MRFHLTRISRNRKTGPMPVVTASKDTCPQTCGLLGDKGCYAENGQLGWFWKKLSSGEIVSLNFDQLLSEIRALPRRQIWRYGQAGDLPDDSKLVMDLALANRHRPVICYTHKRDIETYKKASEQGLNINLSADTLSEADDLTATGLPVVVVLDSRYAKGDRETLTEYRQRLGGKISTQTPGGRKIAVCPAAYTETNCLACGACAKPRPGGTIIGFPAHGARSRRIDRQLDTGGTARGRGLQEGNAVALGSSVGEPGAAR